MPPMPVSPAGRMPTGSRCCKVACSRSRSSERPTKSGFWGTARRTEPGPAGFFQDPQGLLDRRESGTGGTLGPADQLGGLLRDGHVAADVHRRPRDRGDQRGEIGRVEGGQCSHQGRTVHRACPMTSGRGMILSFASVSIVIALASAERLSRGFSRTLEPGQTRTLCVSPARKTTDLAVCVLPMPPDR